MNIRALLGSAGILAATTFGAGVFALPFVFKGAGWITGIAYLVSLGFIVGLANFLYGRVLLKTAERNRLLGLTRSYLGQGVYYFAAAVIVGGLILTLLAYLALADRFVAVLWTNGALVGALPFWLIGSLPLLFGLTWFVGMEFLGIIAMAAIVIFILATAGAGISLVGVPFFNPQNIFMPFGAVLFALAGWTAIEPMYEYEKRYGVQRSQFKAALTVGTAVVGALNLLFVVGILTSTPTVSPDAISGLTLWPAWKVKLLAVLGLLAIWTSYLPIAREVRNALRSDLKWSAFASTLVVLFLPLTLYLAGLRDFLKIVSLVGGVFLGLQYFFIVLVSKRALTLSPKFKFLLNILAALFVLAAVYEIYYFVR